MSQSGLSLEQERAIDLAKEGLVKAAEKLLDDAHVDRFEGNDFGKSQFRNVFTVACETGSPAVVANFIRYQMGRDGNPRKDGKHWRKRIGGSTLGDRLIEAIEGPQGAVSLQIQDAALRDLESRGLQLARIALIRHFLGFASRYLKYLELRRSQR